MVIPFPFSEKEKKLLVNEGKKKWHLVPEKRRIEGKRERGRGMNTATKN